ncbi:16S rRNA (adenine(1518)-N(6)/adenine(1519)-N(6))-dimethyltransferase RsmA [Chloroflexota bacterium]
MKQESLLARTQKILRRFDFKTRKQLGQHFLIDEDVLQFIVNAAELTPADNVIEVGAGLGVLTQELAQRAGRLFAIEMDDKLAKILQKTPASFPNTTIINENVLNIAPSSLSATEPYKVVANLPYYITSPVLRHFLEAKAKPQMILVMVQKEVAEVIAARAGQRSVLSISVQFYGRPEIVRYVPASAFYPAPEVDSALLKIAVYPEPIVAVSNVEGFFAIVRAGFTTPRKQIANSLSQGLNIAKGEAQHLLEQAGVAPQRRAETLTMEEWAKLYEVHTTGAN